jgi:hypothetical protein
MTILENENFGWCQGGPSEIPSQKRVHDDGDLLVFDEFILLGQLEMRGDRQGGQNWLGAFIAFLFADPLIETLGNCPGLVIQPDGRGCGRQPQHIWFAPDSRKSLELPDHLPSRLAVGLT